MNFSECLVELLISVVELEPSVCKRQHILALLGAYSATCSTAGMKIVQCPNPQCYYSNVSFYRTLVDLATN